MPRPARKNTPGQQAATKARADVKAAREKLAKVKNKENEAALKTALSALAEANKGLRRERFSAVGTQRGKAILRAITAFSGCANPRSYVFGPADLDKAFASFETALVAARKKFDDALAANGNKPADPEFSL